MWRATRRRSTPSRPGEEPGHEGGQSNPIDPLPPVRRGIAVVGGFLVAGWHRGAFSKICPLCAMILLRRAEIIIPKPNHVLPLKRRRNGASAEVAVPAIRARG